MISVLLATYNGERYLEEQLKSLFSQTIQDFSIYACDDCSEDGTWDILNEYKSRFPNRMVVEQRAKNSGDAKYNFMDLMIRYKDDYVMLCDQDDVWLPDKIEKTLLRIKELEDEYGKDTLILAHSDLTVVDKELSVLEPSFQKMMGLTPVATLEQAILQNNVTGCTVMYNRALADYLQSMPDYFVMHDWWLALVVACFGIIRQIPENRILYRQHEKNALGARKIRSVQHYLYRVSNVSKIRKDRFSTFKQAGAFLHLYEDQLDTGQRSTLAVYASLVKKNKFSRLYTMKKNHMFRKGLRRKLIQILFW